MKLNKEFNIFEIQLSIMCYLFLYLETTLES